MSSELWIPNSDNWAWFSNHLQHVWSTLVWGAVKRGQPCVAAFKDGRQLRAHRQQCVTHPQFSIAQTKQIKQQRTLWTAWGEIVRDEGWMSIPDERIESNEMAAEMGVGAPKHRPCSWRSPTFRSLSKHCFSIVFVVIWNAIVSNKYPSSVAFYWEPRGGQTFFHQIFAKLSSSKCQGSFPKKGQSAK